MKYELIDRLFQGNKEQALQQIQQIYEKEGFAIVSYVYGAVIVRNKLLKQPSPQPSPNCPRFTQTRRGRQEEKRIKSLFGSSIILPDGAALRTWWRVAHWLDRVVGVSNLTNLNGTDFFPYLLEEYLKVGPVNLVCYAVYDENLGLSKGLLLDKAGKWLQEYYGMAWTYAQDTPYVNDDMSDWNWKAMQAACNPECPTIMMVCRGVPRQEIWSYENRDNLKKYHVLACNQGGTLDYWAGRESRAPRLVRKLWLESVWRVIINPRKNWSKFWVSWQMMGEIVKLLFKSRRVEE